MKKYLLATALFLTLQIGIHTQEQKFKFGWTPFNLGVSYDFLNTAFSIDYSFLKIDTIFFERVNLGTSIMSFKQYRADDIVTHSFLPVEIGFILWKHDGLYWSLYSRGEWMFVQDTHPFFTGQFIHQNNSFEGTFGTRLFILFDSKTGYDLYSSIYFEYTTSNKLRVGITLDLGIGLMFTGIMSLGYAKEKSAEFEREYRKKHPFPWE
jgi:hypothetical protein